MIFLIFYRLKKHFFQRKSAIFAPENIKSGFTEDSVKYNIDKLQQYGRLKRENGRKNGCWVVIDLE